MPTKQLVPFALALALALNCQPVAAVCNPSNCSGCCAADHTCRGGDTVDACGSGGQSCESCLSGQTCDQFQCVNLPADAGRTQDSGHADAGGPRPDAGGGGTDGGNLQDGGGPVVGYCKLWGDIVQPPPVIDEKVGDPGTTVYGQVWAPGVTDSAGQGPGIAGALGYGPVGSEPSAGGWTWVTASYHVDQHGGSNDEYQGTLPDPGLGSYAFAYRFSLNGGPWTYCDADGSNNGYSPSQAGTLNVTALGVDWCNLQYPPTVSVAAGSTSPLIYGRVIATHITDGTGQGPGIKAELGLGALDAGPSTWSWIPASFNTKYGAADEYQASVTAPAAGTYGYLYRFSYDGGAPVYCDLNGGDGGQPLTAPGILTSTPPPYYQYVFVIAEENQDSTTIYNSAPPYIAALMADGGHALNYQDPLVGANNLPSEPHYVWMEAGSNSFPDFTFTNDNDASGSNSTNANQHLVDQIRAGAGDSWLAYQENLPAACPINTAIPYAAKHDPFVFFQDVSGNPPSTGNGYCGQHHRDFSSFLSDLQAVPTRVARYNFITPNLCNDMHGDPSCSNGCTAAGSACITAGDNWLAANLPALIAFCAQNRGVIFIVWDEAENGNVNPFIVLGPTVIPGRTNSIVYTHSSLVRSVEEILSLPPISNVTTANDFSDFFRPGTFP